MAKHQITKNNFPYMVIPQKACINVSYGITMEIGIFYMIIMSRNKFLRQFHGRTPHLPRSSNQYKRRVIPCRVHCYQHNPPEKPKLDERRRVDTDKTSSGDVLKRSFVWEEITAHINATFLQTKRSKEQVIKKWRNISSLQKLAENRRTVNVMGK